MCACSVEQPETILLLVPIVISRSVPKPDAPAATAVCKTIDIFSKDGCLLCCGASSPGDVLQFCL